MENKKSKVNISSFETVEVDDIYEDERKDDTENDNNLRWMDVELPPPSHFKQHVWNDRLMENKQLYGRNGNFYIGNIGLKNGKGMGKLYSKTEDEYIDGEWNNGQIKKLYYCQFECYKTDTQKYFIRINGNDNVITFNNGCFIGRFKNINALGNIDFNRSFNEIKRVIFATIEIVQILQDDKLILKNEALKSFQLTFSTICEGTFDDIRNAEDLFHVLVIISSNRKFIQFDSNKYILDSIIKHAGISSVLKMKARSLVGFEEELRKRYDNFPKLNESVSIASNINEMIQNVSSRGLENHKNRLFTSEASSFIGNINEELQRMLVRDTIRILCLTRNDIELFTYMSLYIDQQKYSIKERKQAYKTTFGGFLKYLWGKFKNNVNKINTDNLKSFANVVPLTSNNYIYLFKSFQELTVEIDAILFQANNAQPLLVTAESSGTITLVKELPWPESTKMKFKSLEYQWRFIHDKLMKHFSPEYISASLSNFDYKYKIIGQLKETSSNQSYFQNCVKFFKKFVSKDDTIALLENMNEEQLVWLYIVDNTISKLYEKNMLEETKPILNYLINSILNGFINFIKQNKNRYESFRIGVHNIIKFIVQVSMYLNNNTKDGQSISLINKQVELINYVINNYDSVQLSEYFPNLIDIFTAFWENKKLYIDDLSKQFSSYWLQDELKEVAKRLLTLLDDALTNEKPQVDVLITFMRRYNEFSLTIKQIDFFWYVKSTSLTLTSLYTKNTFKIVDNTLKDEDKRTYIVIDPVSFTNEFNSNGHPIPKHFIINVVKDLLKLMIDFLNGDIQMVFQTTVNDRLKLTNSLTAAIDKSFLYLKEQADYRDFQLFYDESIYPFKSVINKSTSLNDFEKSIGKIKESFWFYRKQDEIGITEALRLFTEFNSKFMSTATMRNSVSILEQCYDVYLKEFNSYIENISDLLQNESKIINNVHKLLESECKLDVTKNNSFTFDKWTSAFKKETIPKILAGLSAVWSMNESKNISGIQGKCLKPHCLQILSIFRLMNVDDDTTGVAKHLAQISTGQGKSIVLGLLSLLLSLLGYKIQTVCYSDYLSKRDQNAFDYLFKKFLKSSKCITYGTFDGMADNVLTCEVNGKSYGVRDLVKEQIINENNKACDGDFIKNDVSRTILLIDEVDVFFTKEFYGRLYSAVTLIKFHALKDIHSKIWNLVHNDGATDKDTIKTAIEDYIQKIINNKSDRQFNKFYEKIKLYSLFDEQYTNRRLLSEQLDVMIKSALEVERTGHDDDYRLDDEGYITFKRSRDGVYTRNTIVGYETMFNYFRLKGSNFDDKGMENYGYLNIRAGKISYAKLPIEYPLILGVSGTLTSLNKSEKNVVEDTYNIRKMSVIPSFFGHSNLKFDGRNNFMIKEDTDGWLMSIYTSIDEHVKQNRAVLVVFDADSNLNKFHEKYENRIGYLQILSINSKNMEHLINESGEPKKCTLITREMGRGVDYKTCVAVETNGGVHVIQTFFSMDIKEETQIMGRTARKDNKGTYELILCRLHLEKLKISKDSSDNTISTYHEICKEREKMAEQAGKNLEKQIEDADKEHNKTMTYFKSFFS